MVSHIRAAPRLTAPVQAERQAVVHTHGNRAGLVARPLATALRTPVVHSPHSFAYVSQRHRPRPGIELRRALTLGIERVLAPSARVIVCVSEHERRDALEHGIGKPERLVVVYTGIEPF